MSDDTNLKPVTQTVSTALRQMFVDDGGLPLDDPQVLENEKNQRGRPGDVPQPASEDSPQLPTDDETA